MNKIKSNMTYLLGICAWTLIAAQSQAATIGLTLSSDKDPLAVSAGEMITFTVGMTPDQDITGYTLDIRYDTTELSFLSSQQMVPFFNGGFVPPFTLDPATTAGDTGSTGLATSDSGRASVLQVSNSDPVGTLFSLTFDVLTTNADGLTDLTVGILNAGYDDINPPIGGSPFTITPDSVSASVGAVPLPAAAWLFGSGLVGMIGIARRKQVG